MEVRDGTHHDATAWDGQGMKALHGGIPLLLLLRVEPLKTFDSVEHATALLGIHVVQAIELIEFALLGCRIELAKAGFTLQGAMLLSRGEIFVVFNPLGKMAFALRRWRSGHHCRPIGRIHLLRSHWRAALRTLDGPGLRSEGVGERSPCKQKNGACA